MSVFRIYHSTHYSYTGPVHLDPHRALLKPRTSPALTVLSHALTVDPVPAGQSVIRDASDNVAHALWFGGLTTLLKIDALSVVETHDFNPFNFLVYPVECAYLPFAYSAADLQAISQYIGATAQMGPVHTFANRVLQASGGQTITTLIGLCNKIAHEFSYHARETGAAYAPEQTLEHKSGTCRDFTVLFMAAARALGLAARYVSGYVLGNGEAIQHELHAWAEVYVPGAGWLGFDPTLGVVAGSDHVAIATAAAPAQVAPIQGIYRGSAKVSMTFKVDIDPA